MDSITHILSAALWTEPARPPAASEREGATYARWRERLTLIVGALLPDIDGILGWIEGMGWSDLPLYAKYHRTVTHSVSGLTAVMLIAAACGRWWPAHWRLPSMRRGETGRETVSPSGRRLLGVAAVAVGFHLLGDVVTAWGTLRLLWPCSDMDVQLGRVNSIEPVLLTLTLVAWAVQHLLVVRARHRWAWAVAVFWLALCAGYVWLRPLFGTEAFV